MMEFDLNRVKDLLRFEDLFATPNNYMSEANNLPTIELDSVPLYKLEIDMKILFTPKLRYYAQRVENEVNRHLNAAFNLLEDQEDDQTLTKFIVKKTRDAVTTLVNEINGKIARLDPNSKNWKNIISEAPNYNALSGNLEAVSFCHYSLAQLARCWLELQDRYAYVIGKQLYDVNLFYSTFVRSTPDAELKLGNTAEYAEEAKKFKNFREDCCFLYDNEEYFSLAVQDFMRKLKQHKQIPDEVDFKKMETLFRGHPTRNKFTWLGNNSILTHVIKGLCDGDNPIITPWPEGTSKWAVVAARFCDEKGNSLPKISNLKEGKKIKPIVDELIETLAGYK